ncbi:hypothetical protein KCV07_g10099, partial [Aureobasidium melanogenum]
MPTTDDFIPLREDPETVYVDEDDFTESDIEDMDSGSEDETPMAIDYWFGKMYLRCTIAERVLRDSSYKDAFKAADVGQITQILIMFVFRVNADTSQSRLDTKLQQYPYDEILTSLQAQGIARPDCATAVRHPTIAQTEASRITLLTLIGNIVRSGGRSERRALLTCLRGSEEADPPYHHQETSSILTSFRQAELLPQEGRRSDTLAISTEQHSTSTTEQDGQVKEMAKYTMALKEHGDRISAQPSYKTTTISQCPPWFKSVVAFKGFEENGESRTKKDAKHAASRKMCERMRIQPD